MKVKVEILKLVGQTGLKKVGSVVQVDKDTAKRWVASGWVKYVEKPKVKKELKQKVETKELKQKRTTKTKK